MTPGLDTAHDVAALQRLGVKLFLDPACTLDLEVAIRVFHRFIRTGAADGLLVDVTDYRHVHEGPGVLLIAHEGTYSLDLSEGRLGLQYMRKQPLAGDLVARLVAACRIALHACRQLELAPELDGPVRFQADELLVLSNDRLRAPSTEAAAEALQRPVADVWARLHGAATGEVSRRGTPAERLQLVARASSDPGVSALLSRLSNGTF